MALIKLTQTREFGETFTIFVLFTGDETYFEMPGKCTFQDRWLADERYKDWILKDAVNKYFAKCAICVKGLNLTSIGKSVFWKHAGADRHKKKLK